MSFGMLAAAVDREAGKARALTAASNDTMPANPAGVPRRPMPAYARPNDLFEIDAMLNFFGAYSDMLPPTRAEAMSVPAMARARHIITTPARLPLVVQPAGYRNSALIDQPDPNRTRLAVLTDTLDDLLFHGYAWWRVTRRYEGSGKPRHAVHVDTERVTRDESGQYFIDDVPVRAADLIYFEGPHEGVLTFGGRALRSAVRLDRAYNAAANNPAIVAELHQVSEDPMSPDEITELVNAARAAIAAHGVLYTNAAMQLNTHSASAENLLVSGRNAAAVDIARVTGLPATVLDAHAPGSSGTYENVQARLREARDIGVDAYSTAISDRLSMDDILPAGRWCAFDWDGLLREDFNTRMTGYATAIAAGVYTVEECRAMERGQPKEGVPL